MRGRHKTGHIMTFSGAPDEKGIRTVSATRTEQVTMEGGADVRVVERHYMWKRDACHVEVTEIVKTAMGTLSIDDVPADVLQRLMAKRRKTDHG